MICAWIMLGEEGLHRGLLGGELADQSHSSSGLLDLFRGVRHSVWFFSIFRKHFSEV